MVVRQRIVLVAALAFALYVVAVTANAVWDGTFSDSGWFAYAPNTGVIVNGDPYTAAWRSCAVYLVATAVWAGISVWLLRARDPEAEE
jgi:hypothetical protein